MREGVFVPDLTRSGVRVRGLGLVWTSGPTRSDRDQHQTRSRTRHRNLTRLVSYVLLTSLKKTGYKSDAYIYVIRGAASFSLTYIYVNRGQRVLIQRLKFVTQFPRVNQFEIELYKETKFFVEHPLLALVSGG